MNILITAIGSMSAECVINKLHENGHHVIGCDIYPKEWHYEASLCDVFYQVPLATQRDKYIRFLLDICSTENVKCLIPLTDLEIDVINGRREVFEEEDIVICMQNTEVLDVVRNKYKLYQFFSDDINVPSIFTQLLSEIDKNKIVYPLIAKPYNGRSSEGLIVVKSTEQLYSIEDKARYIVQEFKEGPIFTVDYIRDANKKMEMAVPRQELLRTKNGAGLTVQITNNHILRDLVSYIGEKLNINGCVNMEFIYNRGSYFLIDINPRFSAGVAFSVLSGYDMINNHLRCFCGECIDASIDFKNSIIVKKYSEVIL